MKLDTNGYYALGVPAYVLLMGVELGLARRKGLRPYRFADTVSNLSGGLGEVVIGIFLGPLLYDLYSFGYRTIALFHWPQAPLGRALSWIAAFLGADLCYYAYHRASHSVSLFWAIHGVHHQSEEFNVSLALRNPWFSDFYSALFYWPMPLIGIGPQQFFVAISCVSFYAVTVHTRVFHRPGFFALVTPATHIVHHARNPRYIGRNLGAMFTLWDRIFGTHVEVDPAEPPILGNPRGYETHDGAKAQWIFFRDIREKLRHCRSWGERLRACLGFPGWEPAGHSLERRAPARADSEIPGTIRVYVAAQFALMTCLAWYVFVRGGSMRGWVAATLAVQVLMSLSTLGGLLDGRRLSLRWEAARVVSLAVIAGALVAGSGSV